MLAVAAAEPNRTAGAVVSMAEPHVCAPIDANGNLTGDGTRTFEWDIRDQVVAATVGTHRSEFTYDGQRRRVGIVEKENSVVSSENKLLWCGNAPCEERSSDGLTITRRPLDQGEQVAGVTRYFAPDHLGSIRDVTNGSSTVLARYEFDAWGRRTLSAGTDVTSIGFTGHEYHGGSALWLTRFRGYDAEIGRWLSEDPASFIDGVNLYSYVSNTPVISVDALGLSRQMPTSYVPCEFEELKQCEAKCGGPSKVAVCNFKVVSVLRGTYRGPNGDTLKRYYEKRGPMNCVCKEEPVCGEKCQLMVIFVFGLAKLAAACVARNPALAMP